MEDELELIGKGVCSLTFGVLGSDSQDSRSPANSEHRLAPSSRQVISFRSYTFRSPSSRTFRPNPVFADSKLPTPHNPNRIDRHSQRLGRRTGKHPSRDRFKGPGNADFVDGAKVG